MLVAVVPEGCNRDHCEDGVVTQGLQAGGCGGLEGSRSRMTDCCCRTTPSIPSAPLAFLFLQSVVVTETAGHLRPQEAEEGGQEPWAPVRAGGGGGVQQQHGH